MKIGIAHKTVAEVRSFTTQDVRLNPKVYITDSGKEGEFIYDSTDTTTADNLGTILVTASGARYKRIYNEDKITEALKRRSYDEYHKKSFWSTADHADDNGRLGLDGSGGNRQ